MLSSADLKKIVAEARPLIEQQLDLTEQVAGLRDVVTAAGGDWSQLKALVKAQIQDERDEAGDGKRVRKILDKADYAASYADMLGLANMNEKNSFADEIEGIDPQLLAMLVEGSQTEVGRSIIFAALKAVQDGETDFQPDTGEVIEPSGNSGEFNSISGNGAGGAEDEAQVAAVSAPSSAQPNPVANVGEGANGAEAVASVDPASREIDGADRQQPATSGFTGEGEAVSAVLPTNSDGIGNTDSIRPQPAEGTTPTSAADGDRSGQVPPPSQPAPVATTYPEPGVLVMETCPPEGIVEHPFVRCWPVNQIDVTGGVRQPIIKQGKYIVDGRGRFYAARDAGIAYPVVQHDGADLLGDIIRWNLASRGPSEAQRKIIAHKLAKLEPGRADEIMQLFRLHLEAAE